MSKPSPAGAHHGGKITQGSSTPSAFPNRHQKSQGAPSVSPSAEISEVAVGRQHRGQHLSQAFQPPVVIREQPASLAVNTPDHAAAPHTYTRDTTICVEPDKQPQSKRRLKGEACLTSGSAASRVCRERARTERGSLFAVRGMLQAVVSIETRRACCHLGVARS